LIRTFEAKTCNQMHPFAYSNFTTFSNSIPYPWLHPTLPKETIWVSKQVLRERMKMERLINDSVSLRKIRKNTQNSKNTNTKKVINQIKAVSIEAAFSIQQAHNARLSSEQRLNQLNA
ncbi:hypothetical protein ACXA2G_003497, partial [Vibrio cholerae]